MRTDAPETSVGETLVKIVETVSKRLGMDAVVLTVLKENVGAYKFYTEKMGYGVDALSPDDGLEGEFALFDFIKAFRMNKILTSI